ncbi:MAG TPA: hypothetical protein VJG67_00800 [Candidatus Paceibacterota bacterium]
MKYLITKFPIFRSNPRLAGFLGVSVSTFIVGLLFFTVTYLLPGAETVKAEEPNPASLVSKVSNSKSILEVHIASNGMVFLQGGLVESVSGTTIVVGTSWEATKMSWIIHTDASDYGKRHFGTIFLDSKGKKVAITDIRVGDVITVSGTLKPSSSGMILKAEVVRI